MEVKDLGPEASKKISLIAILVVVIIFVFGSFFTVNTGEVGLVFKFGKLTRVESAGLNFKLPLIESVKKLDVKNTKIVTKHNLSTKDMQTFDLDVATEYVVSDPVTMYTKFGLNLVATKLTPLLENKVQEKVTQYSLEEFTKNRPALDKAIYDSITENMEGTGVTIVSVKTGNHDFSDSFEKSINDKKVAEQVAEKQQIENTQMLKNAENSLEIKRKVAQANAIETNSLTPAILQKLWLEKWDGKLPQVVSDKSLVNIPGRE